MIFGQDKAKIQELEKKIKELEELIGSDKVYVGNLERQVGDLAEKFALCQCIVHNIPKPMFITDNELTINYINKEALELFGYPQDDIAYSMKATDLFMPNGIGLEDYPLAKCIKTGNPEVNLKVTYGNKKGQTHFLAITVAPLKNPIGKIKGGFMIISDITSDVKIHEDEKSKLKKDAESQIMQMEKMASIGVLAAGIAHEINNPLGFLISNLESLKVYAQNIDSVKLIKDNRLTIDDLKAMAGESLEGALRIKKIVSDMRTFSRRSESQRIMSDVNQILDSVLAIVWNEIKYKITVIKDYHAKNSIFVDPTQLSQVFLNMLINSSHAIENKGMVTLSTYENDSNIFVKISDSGHGMPPEVLSKMFDPFFSTKKTGTGLGLSVSFNIIKHHGGDIKVESEVGKGTAFTVILPKNTQTQGGG